MMMQFLSVSFVNDPIFDRVQFLCTYTFVDGGCNIGMYTLMVAAMGREVVAVDAMADNLAYIRTSLQLANTENLVTLVHHAIR